MQSPQQNHSPYVRSSKKALTVLTSPVFQGHIESYHELNQKQDFQIRKLLDPKEKIFYSGVVEKINKKSVPQSRILVITDRAVYNIKPKKDVLSSIAFAFAPTSAIKRTIDIKKIFAITLSVSPDLDQEQFILHVSGEYDYRFNGFQSREKIIKSILNVYFRTYKVPFIVYFKEQADLAEYQTKNSDLKSQIDKRPKDDRLFVTLDMISQGLGWIIFNRKELMEQANMFSAENEGYNTPRQGSSPAHFSQVGENSGSGTPSKKSVLSGNVHSLTCSPGSQRGTQSPFKNATPTKSHYYKSQFLGEDEDGDAGTNRKSCSDANNQYFDFQQNE